MALIKHRYLILGTLLLSTKLMAASTGKAFKIEERCREVKTSTGVRYTAPCDWQLPTFVTDPVSNFSEASIISQFPFRDRVLLKFACEALAPIALRWTLGSAQGTTAPDVNAAAIDQILTSDWNVQTLQLSVQNSPGIQYFKPGCHMDVLENFKSIDVKSLGLVLDQINKHRVALEKLFQKMTPDQQASATIQSIDETLAILDFMLLLADDISAIQISESMNSLNVALKGLTQACEVESNAAICTTAQAQSRESVARELAELQGLKRELATFVLAEIPRLTSTPGGTAAAQSLTSLAQKYSLGGF